MLVAATVAGAATGLLQAYGVDFPLTASARAPGGTFGNRNFMAHLTAIGLPALVLIALEARSRAGAVLAVASTGIAGAALLLSRSRAAWLAVAVGLAFLAVEGLVVTGLWRDRRLRRRIAALAGVGITGITLALALPNRLEWKSSNPYFESLVGVANYREGSGRGRLVQYRNSLRMAADHPVLGVGPGNWPVAYPRYTTPGDPAFDWNDPIPTNPWPSSDWVAHAAERGLPALAALGVAGFVMAFVGWRRSRERGKQNDGLAGLTLVATLFVTIVVGTFDAVLLLAAPTYIAWGIAGTLLPPQRAVVTLSPGVAVRRIGIAALLAAGGSLALRTAMQAASMVVAGSGRTLRALEWGARLDPGSYRLHYLAAESARRRCEAVRSHAGRARELFPEHTAPVRLLRRCPGR
jgi:O-antigen ligase